MDKQRHAYILLVHENSEFVLELLQVLDFHLNDIYLHIDKKWTDAPIPAFRNVVSNSNLIISSTRHDVKWGSGSVVQAELDTLQLAHDHGQYGYYHLLSGYDLPVLGIDEIHAFFDGKTESFMDIDTVLSTEQYLRYSRYHFRFLYFLPGIFNRINMWVQKQLRIDRLKHLPKPLVKPAYGSQWASLTEEAVEILINNRRLIRRISRCTHIPDEFYKQTILLGYGLPISSDNKRYIDWSEFKPHPKSLVMADLPAITASKKFFARKISDPCLRRCLIEKVIGEQRQECRQESIAGAALHGDAE